MDEKYWGIHLPRTSATFAVKCPNVNCSNLRTFHCRFSLDPHHSSRVPGHNLPRYFLTRRQPLNRRKLLRPAAFFAGAKTITAIAAVEQFALMPLDEFASVVFVAQHRVQSRTGG